MGWLLRGPSKPSAQSSFAATQRPSSTTQHSVGSQQEPCQLASHPRRRARCGSTHAPRSPMRRVRASARTSAWVRGARRPLGRGLRAAQDAYSSAVPHERLCVERALCLAQLPSAGRLTLLPWESRQAGVLHVDVVFRVHQNVSAPFAFEAASRTRQLCW